MRQGPGQCEPGDDNNNDDDDVDDLDDDDDNAMLMMMTMARTPRRRLSTWRPEPCSAETQSGPSWIPSRGGSSSRSSRSSRSLLLVNYYD